LAFARALAKGAAMMDTHSTAAWPGRHRSVIEKLLAELSSWDQLVIAPHSMNGLEFLLGKKEIGHIHLDGTLDLPFPVALRQELIAAGKAQRHHWLPDSGWVAYSVRSEADIAGAIELLALAYQRRLTTLSRHAARAEAEAQAY
jgi:hypothetical protein